MYYLSLVILFFVLSPGILLNIPPINKKYWRTGKTSVVCAFVHAIVFALALYLLRNYGFI